MTRMTVHLGDITDLMVDAIVNAANESLAPGGGVCGAIHRAAGADLAVECAALGHCPTGEAVITEGHNLAPTRIIHAVGPVWQGGGSGEAALLALAYARSLQLAAQKGCRSVAFPAISTGIYGLPAEQAARIAVNTVAGVLASEPRIRQVIFCCFSEESAALHQAALDQLEDPDVQ
ncbi:macro domain-containing protein [Limibaculum sp. FT325]|uniref:macro domain-containing protein n=1 Tax=Thermohalobaculum sediminis TaxID=2939436 RepID=UPI0020C0FBDA|nr:macro domain-containing protein [Limibaculum sediminis]MCL5775412.1 macro domain-containing protein [Limibaculum sediminis]